DTSRRLPARTTGVLGAQDILTVPDLEAKLAAQVAGLGCGFVPAALAREAVAGGRLVCKRVEDPVPAARMVLAWRSERTGKAHAWWLEALQRSGIGEKLASGATQARRGRATKPRRR